MPESHKTLRVLIVDDSPMMCRILSDMLTADKDIVIAGTAKNGEDALEKAATLKPDLVTLDVNMPVMDGATALKHIMIRHPCPVVILGAVESGSDSSDILDFLRFGAVDFIKKPVRNNDMASQQRELIRRVRLAAKANVANFRRAKSPKVIDAENVPAQSMGTGNELETRFTQSAGTGKELETRFTQSMGTGNELETRFTQSAGMRNEKSLPSAEKLVIVSSGAGGYAELVNIIPRMPENSDACLIVFQTMPNMFLLPLSDYFSKRTRADVRPLDRDSKLVPGRCCIADAETIKAYSRTSGSGEKTSPAESQTESQTDSESFDFFLHSVSEAFSGKILVALLSGAEVGNLSGLSDIRKRGGKIIVQRLSSCMAPHSLALAIARNLVDAELNSDEICRLIVSGR
jgi:two-component system chemotaxis response regulator CheB